VIRRLTASADLVLTGKLAWGKNRAGRNPWPSIFPGSLAECW
jgi:hypothetical protein